MTTTRILLLIPAILACLCMGACSGCSTQRTTASETSTPASQTVQKVDIPAFDADSAYAYVSRQVAMGPRVNNTAAHRRCEQWLVESMRQFGADTVIEQRGVVHDHAGRALDINNIIARFNPSATKRILLLAHYDTRPIADQDPDPAKRDKPVPGANDGASGVGVLLEVARQLGQKAAPVGVDILLTDAEDCGTDEGPDSELTWALGTQYFMEHLPYASTTEMPAYAILLDMVGGTGATFKREYFSQRFAPEINAKVWNAANDAGLSARFKSGQGPGVVDDHVFVNRGGIPAIDIIECENAETGSFPPYWHTLADDMPIIDRSTLGDVGTVLMRIIYTETAPAATSQQP
ncbi:MAG: M28 family peptidase [Candidatus Amulumruptor sp.]